MKVIQPTHAEAGNRTSVQIRLVSAEGSSDAWRKTLASASHEMISALVLTKAPRVGFKREFAGVATWGISFLKRSQHGARVVLSHRTASMQFFGLFTMCANRGEALGIDVSFLKAVLLAAILTIVVAGSIGSTGSTGAFLSIEHFSALKGSGSIGPGRYFSPERRSAGGSCRSGSDHHRRGFAAPYSDRLAVTADTRSAAANPVQ